MQTSTTFDSTKEQLSDMLSSIRVAKTQLPDFQRGWIWDDDHIRSLLASISRSFPIGAVMMLQTGNPNVRFKPRSVQGAPECKGCTPERLILDGQQRLTSLFQALFSGEPVDTKDARGAKIRRWYYVHIPTALDKNADREESIRAIPEARVVANFRREIEMDLSSTEKECAAEMFPLPLVFDQGRFTDWQLRYIQAEPTKVAERLARWNEFVQSIVQPFQQYQVPLILLRKETPKEAVCQVFEKVNTGGVALTVFELLTATFAADDFNLRDDWDVRAKKLARHKVLQKVGNTDLLQAISLMTTYKRREQALQAGVAAADAPGVSCKKPNVLQLSQTDYTVHIEALMSGFERAAKIFHAQHIFAASDLPYPTQVVPLAAACALLGELGDNDGAKKKIARWFWCGVFGELYGGATESRFAKDVVELVAWVRSGVGEPSTIADASFLASRLLTLRTRNSAAYKGLYALLLLDGGLDLRSGDTIDLQTYFDDSIDIHHIFPKKWCADHAIPTGRCNSIVNKTAISAKTNRMIGGNAPSDYLTRLQKSAGIEPERMDMILKSHVIDPQPLRADDFATFFERRERDLLVRIERAMGKAVRVGEAYPDVEEPEDDDEAGEAA